MKSPGRRETAKQCAPKRPKKPRWTYKGPVPKVIEEDREFYLLFSMRCRWLQLMEPPVETPATRLLKVLGRKEDDGRRPSTEQKEDHGN